MKERRVQVFPPEEVTSIHREAEVDPRSLGLDPGKIEGIWGAARRHYATGLHPAIGLCVMVRGQIVLERAIGHLRGNGLPPGDRVPIRYDSLFNLYSGTKAITAMLIHLLDERRQIHLDDPIAEYVRGFERHGKGGITIRQVLTHRAGIPALPGERFNLDLLADRRHILELLCDARPLSAPGRKLAYHALTGGFLLGAVIAEVTGLTASEFLAQEVARPLGLGDFGYGIAPSRVGEVAENVLTGLPLPLLSWFFARSVGLTLEQAVSAANDPRFLTAEVPSGNLITTPRGACRFFEALRQGGTLDGVKVFEPRTIRRATAEQSMLQIDGSIGLPVRYSMGFILGESRMSPYGPHTEQAFGHVGFSNVLLWADPAREISVAYLNTGKPFVTAGQLAFYEVPRTISAAFAP